jgi:hypothetical protein
MINNLGRGRVLRYDAQEKEDFGLTIAALKDQNKCTGAAGAAGGA